MRPIRLVMSAFGPYADQQNLDFSDLQGRKFFLICGPTGAGKTTVLDAICYALYGSTSGDLRSGDDMRSDYAEPDQMTNVEFDFSIGDRYYRVCRSPAQEVPKKRGEGMRLEPSSAALYELTPEGTEKNLIAAKHVTEEVEKLLGFRADQFRQVVLLPQGDFRRLLLASSDERQHIMQQLFHTEIYLRLEKELGDRYRSLEKEYHDISNRIAIQLGEFGAEREDELKAKAGAAEQEERQAEEARRRAEKALNDYRAVYQKAHDLWQHAQRLLKAEQDMGKLEALKNAMNQKRKEEELIRRADSLSEAWKYTEKILDQGTAAKKKLDESQARLIKLRKYQADVDDAWGKILLDEPAWQKKMAEKVRLDQLKASFAQYGDAVQKERVLRRKMENIQKEQKVRSETVKQRETVLERLRGEAERISTLYGQGQASVLASSLQEGQPCPVCGAVHHPSPAAQREGIPSEEDVKQAVSRVRQGETLLLEAQKEAGEYEKNVFYETQRELSALSAVIREKEGLIPAEYRTPGSLDRAAEELEKSIRDYEGRREALRKEKEKTDRNTEMAVQEGKIYESHMEQLRNSYRQGMEVLKHKAGEAGFQSLEECRPWHARIHELNALAEEIKQYDMELAAAGRMAEAERTAVAGQKIPKMEDYDRTMKELQEAFGKSGEEKSRASLQLRRLREALEKIKSWETAQSAAAEKYSLVGGLYELASGRGTGVNFERFVLGALLDEVTESANRRLQQMSRRRYLLQRARERADARKNSGLDMEVFDNYTGCSRAANTLSGGETFLASLSLALGLADVVQAYAGGIHLDTMFIDEGFGTLDPETLDFALQSLLELQKGGRLVGIISHVPELSERIDAQLRITRTDRGSRAAFHVG